MSVEAPRPESLDLALVALEQRLDGLTSRAAGWLLDRWRTRRARGKATLRDWAGLHHGRSQTAPVLALALSQALAAGALESAERLADDLVARLSELAPQQQIGAVTLVLEALQACGRSEQAANLARAHRQGLRGSVRGVSALELLGLGDGSFWLPDGRPNLLGLSRAVAHGALTASALAAQLQPSWRALLQTPELCLLFFAALRESDAGRALAFLNRFLEREGLPLCCLRTTSLRGANLLAELEFERPPQSQDRTLVSVLMAARNASTTICYALDSLLSQTHGSLEILVGDDASDDATLDLVQTRFAKERRVRLFRSARPQGAYNVRNQLAAQAQGEFLTFHDADDLALPTRIATQLAELRNPARVAVLTNWLRVTPEGNVVFFNDQRASRLSMVSNMMKRQAWLAVGPFRSARVGADWELLGKLRRRYGDASLARIRRPLLLGLWGPGSATRSPGTEALENGYRSTARRKYSELVAAQLATGGTSFSDAEIDALLRACDNYVEPSHLNEA